MRHLRWIVLGTVLLAIPAMSSGQPAPPEVWGEAYLSFSPDGRDPSRDVEPFEPVTFYLIIDLDLSEGESVLLGAVEGTIQYAPSLFLSAIDWGGDYLQFGPGLGEGAYDFQLGWNGGEEHTLVDGPNAIGQFTGVLLEEDQLLIGIGPTSVCGSSEDCRPLRWVPRDGSHVIYRAEVNPSEAGLALNRHWTGVAVEPSSWSRLKATFQP